MSQQTITKPQTQHASWRETLLFQIFLTSYSHLVSTKSQHLGKFALSPYWPLPTTAWNQTKT